MYHSSKNYYKRKHDESPQRGRDKDFRTPEPRPIDPPDQGMKSSSTIELFQPLTKQLGLLDTKDPVLAEQAARLVTLYRRIQRLENKNRQLESKNTSLEKEKRNTEDRYEEQRTLLGHFQKSFESVQDDITKICDSWKDAPVVLPQARGDDRPVGKEDQAQTDTASVTPAANEKASGPVAAPVPPRV
ncbi:hypothetical protein FE257_005573 [Aspergillus nanangensis]|uniref:Uncharacterized protein n=1 Tax=Aspergillus nanangensis TaxID=2582783 RepID=A0AAD4CQP3_ASPNN|nr:hypothetical protein FE257_005573 [Aspergillus nanangensis]